MDVKRNALLNNNNMVHVFDGDINIKQEYDGAKVKIEYDEEIKTSLLEQVSVKTEFHDLYKDHTVKEEIVIGPEILQETIIDENKNEKLEIPKHENTPISKREKAGRSKHKNVGRSKPKNPGMSKRKKSIDVNRGIFIKEENDVISTMLENAEISKPAQKSKRKNKESFECDMCHKVFDSRSDIENHIKKCTCKFCGKHYTLPTNLFRHLSTHKSRKKHKCTACDAMFSRKDYLDYHVSKHHTNTIIPNARKPSECELCKKVFSSSYSCRWHMAYSCPKNRDRMKLKKEKWYACDLCDKGYKYRSSLSAHIVKVHMGVRDKKKHECDYCGALYVKKHNLQCHIQWNHMDIRPYSCRYCREKFTWHSTLASHELKVHGKKRSKKIA